MKLKCSNCGGIIETSETEKYVDCLSCGAHGKNPLYKDLNVQTNSNAAIQNNEMMSTFHKGEILRRFGFYIPKGATFDLLKSLAAAPDRKYADCMAVQPKNPAVTLFFAINCGFIGLDRFYIGDTGLGVCKLLFSMLIFGLWPLIDIFVSYKKCKKKNLEALNSAIK